MSGVRSATGERSSVVDAEVVVVAVAVAAVVVLASRIGEIASEVELAVDVLAPSVSSVGETASVDDGVVVESGTVTVPEALPGTKSSVVDAEIVVAVGVVVLASRTGGDTSADGDVDVELASGESLSGEPMEAVDVGTEGS
jgi:hypothetical protein